MADRRVSIEGDGPDSSCQWSPHPATSNLILSTSSQKLLVWDLAAQVCLHRSIDAHARAITDINWHARDPNLMATVSMDAGIRGWDLRTRNVPFMRLCAWGAAGTQVKWNRQHDHILATAHGKEVIVWDNRVGEVVGGTNDRKGVSRLPSSRRMMPRFMESIGIGGTDTSS
jgi:WD40 repeat protein